MSDQLAQPKHDSSLERKDDEDDGQIIQESLLFQKNSTQPLKANEEEKKDLKQNAGSKGSDSSSPSSTSSDGDSTQVKHKVKAQNNDQSSNNHSNEAAQNYLAQSSLNEGLNDPKQSLNELQKDANQQENQAQQQDKADSEDSQNDQQNNAKGEALEDKANDQMKKVDDISDDSDIEDFDDDDDNTQTVSSFVVEESPKGRFGRYGEELGRGAYKIVYKGIDNETGREIAWNAINLKRLPKNDKIRIKSEINLIKLLEHKNIIHFISAWVNKQKEQVIFITEMITGGSLRKYVKRIKHPRLRVIKGWCIEILQGLVYLHDQKPYPIIHRDLKCDNIFINSHSGEIRIGDLGLSTPMQNSYTTSVLGTPEFMAPELYEECYGTSVDIYAFGMCVLEMVTLERPYKECQNPAQIYNKVIRGIMPNALDRIEDEEVKEFIMQCLVPADKRPSAKDLLESTFMKDLDSQKNNKEVQVKPPIKSQKPQRRSSLEYLKRNGSTIMEEEEENSDDEGKSKVKNIIQQLQQENQTKNNHQQNNNNRQLEDKAEDSELTSQSDDRDPQLSQTQEKLKPSQTIENDNESKKHDYHSNDLNKDSSDQLRMDASQISEMEKLKQRKSSSRKKKLNESVIFLKKIDKGKQSKMLEKTLLGRVESVADNDQASQQSGESDKEKKAKAQENILDELYQQEREKEKLQYEQEQLQIQKQQQQQQNQQQLQNQQLHSQQLLQQQHQQQNHHQQHAKNESDSEHSHSNNKINLQQYNSSDQNTKVHHSTGGITSANINPHLLDNGEASVKSVVNSEQFKKEKREAHAIGKGKNFKEDSKLQTQNKQPQKSNLLEINKNIHSSPYIGSISDDLRRTNSNDQQALVDHANKHAQLSQKQGYDAKKAIPHQSLSYYHQSSDSHLSSQPNNQPPFQKQSTQKLPQVKSQLMEKSPQAEGVFDVQSSSENSEDHDSEVDNIVLPKTTHNDEFFQISNNSLPNTPFNDNQVQNRLSVDSQLKASLKKAGTSKQLLIPQQHNFPSSNSINKDNQNKPKSTNSTQQQNQQQQQQQQQPQTQQASQQTQHSNSSQKMNAPNDESKLVTKSSFGPDYKQQAKPQATEQKANITQPQQQQAKDQQKTPTSQQSVASATSRPQTQSSSQAQQQVYLHSSERVEDKPYLHNMVFKVRSQDGTSDNDVLFEFDVRNDTAHGVADEMVRELQLPASQIQVIESLIKFQIQSQQPKPQQKQQQQEQPSIQIAPLSQTQSAPSQITQPQKKDSPMKISKDAANTYFNKLFENVDSFFVYMQSKNIGSIDEITEAMDLSQEEAQIRAQFLNQVLQAKRTYKKSIEEFKKKQEAKKKQTQEASLQVKAKVSSDKTPTGSSQTKQSQNQQSQLNQQNFSQSNQQARKLIGEPNIKRVNSKQDVANPLSFQDEKKVEEKKEIQLIVPQPTPKLTFLIPSFVRKQFKIAPQQIVIHQKLSKVLKQVPEGMPDEEVQSLQQMLNLIFEVSIIEMMTNIKELSSDSQSVVHNYLPLRIDGFYGEKTEASVVKFQKHISVPQDCVVNDSLWQTLLSYVDYIVKDDQKKQIEKIQQQQLLEKQQQIQQSQTPQMVQNYSQKPQQETSKQSVQQVINIASQVQLISLNQQPSSTQMKSSHSQSQNFQQAYAKVGQDQQSTIQAQSSSKSLKPYHQKLSPTNAQQIKMGNSDLDQDDILQKRKSKFSHMKQTAPPLDDEDSDLQQQNRSNFNNQ